MLCDLSLPIEVAKLLKKIQPDVIINLAASVDFQEREVKNFFPINVLLPAIIGNYCVQKQSYLVHSSGIIVHGISHELYNINTELLYSVEYFVRTFVNLTSGGLKVYFLLK